jgi:hypothetical protein
MWYRGYFWIALGLDRMSGSVLCLDWDVTARGCGWVDASSYHGTLTAHAESPFHSVDYRTLPWLMIDINNLS